MEYKFYQGQYADDFRFGGALAITAENPQEVEQLIAHFRLYADVSDVATLRERIEALESGTLTHVMKSNKRPIYAVDSCLDYEFTAPYKAWALRDLGYDGVFPDLVIPRKWGGLIHTNYQARLYTDKEHICFEAFTGSQPWNKLEAHDYAARRVVDSIGEEFGARFSEPEFIQGANNHYKRNPDYMKRHAAQPSASNARLKRAFFVWWLENCATPAQKEVVEGNREISKGQTYMGSFDFERPQSHIYYERTREDYKSLSFSDFAAMGAGS